MQSFKLDSTGWTLNVLAYGEATPLENHHAFELGSDDDLKQIWGHEMLVRTMGLDSIKNACIAYANKRNKNHETD